ncbi:hypothetical protein A6F68_02765 [Tsuneonella dongtanensis]|uniref:Lipoprotein n=1 Tax=Tsuneonella dongtanensis TaxID=692370 RepID=A0A1B2AGU0_9SPHN|nr:hypothetical protein [Tsuneonella dongtanensis]ANY21255.1 hypothetical protein A6F68_02765 [Tsuneonella dongtanensis]
MASRFASMTRAYPLVALVALTLAACSQEAAPPSDDATSEPSPAAVPTPGQSMPATDAGKTFPAGTWEMASSGEGDGLFFGVTEGEPARIHLFCPSGGALLVNGNSFRPIGSEERMSFGSGATVVTLVADPAGDPDRGGVSGEWTSGGPVPANLGAILTGAEGVSVSYGAQAIALPPVPAATAELFVTGCTD